MIKVSGTICLLCCKVNAIRPPGSWIYWLMWTNLALVFFVVDGTKSKWGDRGKLWTFRLNGNAHIITQRCKHILFSLCCLLITIYSFQGLLLFIPVRLRLNNPCIFYFFFSCISAAYAHTEILSPQTVWIISKHNLTQKKGASQCHTYPKPGDKINLFKLESAITRWLRLLNKHIVINLHRRPQAMQRGGEDRGESNFLQRQKQDKVHQQKKK